ncbi:MAG: M20/M25/M40 family metallo-hydrolase [Deferribacteres bacterium]|nr:M20/M25/M40 family metallo-hydrolase [candidate division KSB1 bacterium]MCB9500727.1 M20/M25/M40 family metallo-hydrolase [Deferribacteres bacterium]
MRKIMFYTMILSFVISFQASAQEKIDWQTVQKIRTEGLENSQVMDILFMLTDASGQRLTGSPALMEASKWSRDKLSEWGLENAQIEAWGTFGRGWSFDKVSVAMVEPVYMPVIAYPKAWTPGTEGELTGTPVLLKIENEEDIQKYQGKLEGAIVLVQGSEAYKFSFEPDATRLTEDELAGLARLDLEKEKSDSNREERIKMWRARFALQRKVNEFLQNEGIKATIEPSHWANGIVRLGGASRTAYKPGQAPAFAQLVVAMEHYNRITRLVDKGHAVKLAIEVKTTFYDEDSLAYNVIAEIPGVDRKLKSEIVMLGGHLDSWHAGTGATDNASGSAVMMEAVRILKTIGVKPRRTIRIALWSGEEQGLLGSRGYVKKHLADPKTMELTAEHEKFSAYFNLDNGSGRIRGIYLQGNQAVKPIFTAYLEPFHDLDAKTVTIDNTSGTDHLAFDAVGLPGFQFIQDKLEYFTRTHHANMDTYDHVSANDLKQAATIIASFVYHTAMRDEKLPRKPLPEPKKDPEMTSR